MPGAMKIFPLTKGGGEKRLGVVRLGFPEPIKTTP